MPNNICQQKSTPQTSTSKRLLILSRIKHAKIRADLEIIGDGWGGGCIFYDEKQAQREYAWLKTHSDVREYILVAQVVEQPPKISRFDGLDDDILF